MTDNLETSSLSQACQQAEHNFVGIKCGVMDQFASVMGQEDQVLLLDCRTLDFQYFPFDLGEYQLLLLNTNVIHSLANSEYNTRRSECEQGVALLQQFYPGIESLRDATLEQLSQQQGVMPDPVFRRCRHIITENQRVLDATKALQDNDFTTLGQLLYTCHTSLKKDYEVSCLELDFLVEQALSNDAVLGARMMGGGFGGCTINIIKKSEAAAFIEQASSAYQKHFGLQLTPYEVKIDNGAQIIH